LFFQFLKGSSLRLISVPFILKYTRKRHLRKSLRRVRGASRPMRRFLFARSSSGQICNAICARACIHAHAIRSNECVSASTKGARQYSFKTESSERVARRGAREGQRGKQKQVRASNSGRPCCRLPTAFLQHNAPRATHTSGTIHGIHTHTRAHTYTHATSYTYSVGLRGITALGSHRYHHEDEYGWICANRLCALSFVEFKSQSPEKRILS